MSAAIDAGRRRFIAGAVALGSGLPIISAQANPRVIAITARKFVFEPNEIRLKLGEPLVLQFTAPEVPMGFALPDFSKRIDILPGLSARLAFTPDKAGSFGFVCDTFCGSGHEDMGGTLIVVA